MKTITDGSEQSRRNALKNMVGLGSIAVLGGGVQSALAHPTMPVRFNDPEWNRDALARLQGNLSFGKVKYGSYSGTVCGVRDGEAVRPIMGYEGFSATRLVDNGDGSYQKLLREVLYYTDLATGDILERYTNPYTGEVVKVVPVANDPFNLVLEKYYPKSPSYGGLRAADEARRPMLLPWRITKPDTVTLATDIHMYYPSALQPEKWPRESAGKSVRVSELFRYVIAKEDLEDPSLTSVEFTGTWSRVTPWLPWMLMGQAPGHILYMGFMGGYDNLNMASDAVIKYAQKHHPKFFDAPAEWVEPSLSSLEDYARTQKPAPVK